MTDSRDARHRELWEQLVERADASSRYEVDRSATAYQESSSYGSVELRERSGHRITLELVRHEIVVHGTHESRGKLKPLLARMDLEEGFYLTEIGERSRVSDDEEFPLEERESAEAAAAALFDSLAERDQLFLR